MRILHAPGTNVCDRDVGVKGECEMKNVWFWTLVSIVVVARVGATDYTWSGASGSFQEAANWSPVAVPGTADNAKFTTAGTYAVSFAGDVANTGSTVGANVTLGLNGYAWVLSGSLAFSGTSTARVGNGTLTVGGAVSVGANQKLILDSGSSFFRGSKLESTSGGAIEVNGGDHLLSWAMPLGAAPAGGSSFRMTGGRLSLTNNDNLARCSLWNGAKMSLEGGTLSIRYQVDINGTPAFPVVVDIYTNAALLQCPGIGFNVSRTAGGFGVVNIRGGSLILSNSNCNVVNASGSGLMTTGIVNLIDGTLHAGNLALGYTSNGVAIVQQSGGFTRITSDTYLGKEQKTKGILRQSGGDAAYNWLYVGGFTNSEGEVELSGGRLTIGGNSSAIGKVAGSTGRLIQSGGELFITNALSVGAATATVGVITNTGGIFWLNNTLNIGNSSGSGAFGRASFSGPSNYVKSAINVGNNTLDTGELIVANGELVCDGSVIAGSVTSSTGSVRIAGGTARFKSLTVAQSGVGSLVVSGGLLAVTNGGAFVLGAATGSMATVEISGGTNLFLGQGVTWGQFGSAVVKFSGGYTYTTNRIVVGHNLSATGRVELLPGGVLATPIIDGRVGSQYDPPGGYSEILFDGGTLMHSIDGESWMPGQFVTSFSKALVTARGAVIDSNGGSLVIPQALSNAVGEAGCFTKKGAGKVTLSSWFNAFTGCVAVDAGELAVSTGGGIVLTGGVRVERNALLNLTDAGSVRGLETASGTVSRVDGTLILKSGYTLTNGIGSALGGSGTLTGKVVCATGSAWSCDKTKYTGPLYVSGSTVLPENLAIRLVGFTAADLASGIPLIQSGQGIQSARRLFPVTLDGASHPYWWAKVSGDNLTLTARVISQATMISIR